MIMADKKLKGLNLLAYMYVRTDAKSWADALAYTPNRKEVMLDLRNQLSSLDKLIPSNDAGFLKYLDDVITKDDLLNESLKQVKILGDDTNLRGND
tara:strand:- start:122 stop:409 length:288 start_codon:yes stop_codon:yes gene_type:complete